MQKKIALSTLCIALSTPIMSFAFVMGGSNLPLGMYPEFNGYYNTYNMSISDLEQLRSEVKEYIENGNHDIQRIQEAQEQAIEEYNNAVQAYNAQQQYY